VEIQTEVRDLNAVRAACRRLQLEEPTHGTVKLFSQEKTGWAVKLPGWRYPVVCQIENGQLHYDNYTGRWGEQAQLGKFLQAYAVEKARLEARKQGHLVTEQALADGSIKLTIRLAGGAE